MKTNCTHRTHRFTVPITVATLLLAGLALPAGAKTPPKPPPEPSLTYSLTELGVPAGFVSSKAIGTNASGAAVGSITTADDLRHAAIWPIATEPPIDLGAGLYESIAYAINDHGEVAGWIQSQEPGDEQYPVVWVPDGNGYEMILLSPVDGEASDINNEGVVTGTLWPSDWDPFSLAFVVVPEDVDGDGALDWFYDGYLPDGWNDLLVALQPEGFINYGISLNEHGWIVGHEYGSDFLVIPEDTNGDGLLEWFQDQQPADGWNDLLTVLPEAFDVNNLGQVVGGDLLMQIEVAADGTVSYTTTTLPLPRKITGLDAFGINDAGVVVGRASSRQGPKAFTWDAEAGTTLLQDLVTDMATFSKLECAWDINQAGQIVGTGKTGAGERGFLATPNE